MYKEAYKMYKEANLQKRAGGFGWLLSLLGALGLGAGGMWAYNDYKKSGKDFGDWAGARWGDLSNWFKGLLNKGEEPEKRQLTKPKDMQIQGNVPTKSRSLRDGPKLPLRPNYEGRSLDDGLSIGPTSTPVVKSKPSTPYINPKEVLDGSTAEKLEVGQLGQTPEVPDNMSLGLQRK